MYVLNFSLFGCPEWFRAGRDAVEENGVRLPLVNVDNAPGCFLR
ncbi:hypothetical protein DDI_0641 [Dickeya dianthicola RNS04.9]|nr:hypothetical protein DDI_0641 [Dickeya dianthicola RNS04.9]